VADYLIAKSLNAGTVPSWVTDPYRRIHEDEAEHGNYPFEILVKYATTPEKQERAERAVAMSLVLRAPTSIISTGGYLKESRTSNL
jgi:hypothetical protein